jgi:Carboxypeptidase regulatory-like domain
MEVIHFVCGARRPQLKRDPLGRWPELSKMQEIRQALSMTTTLALIGFGCTRAQYVCPAAPPGPNVDSAYASIAPLRLQPDPTVSGDSIIGIVRRAGAGSPVSMAQLRFRHDTTLETKTDSSGRFALPIPLPAQFVLETRVVGYLPRRDSIEVRSLQYKRLDIALLDSYTFGDIQAVPVCLPSNRGRSD